VDESFPLGCAGDAYRLRLTGDPTDVFHRRPTTDDGRKTDVGVCWNAPCLVLYGARGRIDWPRLLGRDGLRAGRLLSGEAVHVIYLSEADWRPLLLQTDGAPVALGAIREWARRDDVRTRTRRRAVEPARLPRP
jgi:hypothetical protein